MAEKGALGVAETGLLGVVFSDSQTWRSANPLGDPRQD